MSPENSLVKPRRRARWIVPVVLATLLVGGALGYRYWISTPQYSLLQAKGAFEEHDLARFEKYVAVDVCADSLTDDALAEATRQMKRIPDAMNPLGIFGQVIAQATLLSFKPLLSSWVKTSAREWVSTGKLTPLPGRAGGSSIDVGQIKDRLAKRGVRFEGIGNVAVQGDTASVELLFENNGKARELPVQLEMRRIENYWQVSKWKNATAWIQKEIPKMPF